MFVELMPLLKDRTLLLTIARVGGKVKVNVIPAKAKEGEDQALTTCVDTRKGRAAIAKCAEDGSEVDYWLDLGNNADSGQFVLGEPLNRRNRRHSLRLRTVSELFPKVMQRELDEDGLPSCSAAEALDRQEPFVNPTLANHALGLLARLFRYGAISYHGGFLSLSSLCGLQALRVDPKYWRRLRDRSKRRAPSGAAVTANTSKPMRSIAY